MNLAIKSSSWHYKYHEMLRSSWGMQTGQADRISLCKYSHFIFWFSVFTLVLLPVVIIGWLVLKLARSFYKLLSKFRVTQGIADWLDRKFNYSSFIQTRCDNIDRSPISTCLLMFTALVSFLLIIAFCITACFVGIGGIWLFIVKVIPAIPGFLWACVKIFGWAWFQVIWAISFGAIHVGIFFVWIGKIVGVWLVTYIPIILFVIGCILGTGLIGTVLVWLGVKFFTSPKTEFIRKYFIFHLNGFHEAKEANVIRRDEIRQAIANGEMEPSAVSKVCARLGTFISNCWDGLIDGAVWCWRKVTTRKVKVQVKDKERTFNLMGTFSIIVETLKAIKDGVCPYVEIIDESDINGDA